MNKALIKKYKEEFNYWLNGGVLLFKWSHEEPSCWLREDDVISNNLWCHKESNIKYIIIKDEYVEFRIALAEGKTVEVLHYTGYKEFDQNPWKLFAIGVSTFDKPVENYRIKPEKPKFKVGDWVKVTHYFETNSNKYDVGSIIRYHQRVQKNYGLSFNEDCIELWKPQPGEWCWFWDETLNTPQLEQFKKMIEAFECGTTYFLYTTKCGRFINGQIGTKFCEPFIGELPTNLKAN